MNQWVIIVIGAFVALFVLVIVAGVRGEKKRREAIREWALRNGMSYSEGPVDPNQLVPLTKLQPVRLQFTTNKAVNIISGRRGQLDVTMFDLHQRWQGEGDETTNDDQTVSVFKLSGVELGHFQFTPALNAVPGSLQAKLIAGVEAMAKLMPADDGSTFVEIEGHPGWLIRAQDPEAARRLFTPSLISFFEQNAGVALAVDGSHLLIEHGEMIEVGEIDTFLAKGGRIAEQFQRAV